MNFLDFAEKVLNDTKRPLTKMEIWKIGKEMNYDKQLNSSGKTPWQTMAALLYLDLKDNKNSKFYKAEERPTKFYLKSLSNQIKSKEIKIEESDEIKKLKEKDLHKFLSYYVYAFQDIYTKTIYHEESTKKTFGQWAHPDIVGVYYPNWLPEVINLTKELNISPIKLYSYELKISLNFNNLRESFFQAVSNSSWANEGYLVAADILDDENFTNELERLSSSFGIGIIKLDLEDPNSTKTIFQAKFKEVIDLETINKTVFVKGVVAFILRRNQRFLVSLTRV